MDFDLCQISYTAIVGYISFALDSIHKCLRDVPRSESIRHPVTSGYFPITRISGYFSLITSILAYFLFITQ
jgi:hypothetical protein